jgi:hypothetical protein
VFFVVLFVTFVVNILIMEEKLNLDQKWDLESAETAYAVIARYVDHAQVSGLLIAMLASALGEERLKPIVQSEYWQTYLASKRSLSEAREDIERLTLLIERMREETK